jgi:hypothetical protein
LGVDGIGVLMHMCSATKLGTMGGGCGIRPGSLGGILLFDSTITGTSDSEAYGALTLEPGTLGVLFRSTVQGGSGVISEGEEVSLVTFGTLIGALHTDGWGVNAQGHVQLNNGNIFGGSGSGGSFRYSCPSGASNNHFPEALCCTFMDDIVIDGSNTSGTVEATFGTSTASDSGSVTTIGGNTTIVGRYIIGGGGGGGGNVWAVHALASATPYQMTNDDRLVLADTTGVSPTVHLPTSPVEGQIASVKDAGGNAAVNNITLTTGGGGNVFDASLGGGGTYTMAVNNSAFNLCYYSGVWYSV